MTKMKKKYTRGEATTFVSRKQALKRLQLSLNDFRRLCIIKGVYPQEPTNRRRVGKGSSLPKVYYHLKDIQFLGHEKVMQKLRDMKTQLRKAKRAKERGDMETVARLHRNFPTYTLDHIIRERYPSFEDALRDLDDCLCLCFLFARLPKERGVRSELIRLSTRLTVQFLHWVMESRSLRKAFISIKGYYFEADVQGVPVVWTLPHQLGLHNPADVDFKILRTFNEFYTTLLGFVNYRLYSTLGLAYPPALANQVESADYCQDGEAQEEFMASLNQPLLTRRGVAASADGATGALDEGNPAEPDDFPEADADGAEAATAARKKARAQQRLFAECKFFLNRETPRQILCFLIRSCGGQTSWSPDSGPGSRYPETDSRITHQVADRPLGERRIAGRTYVQPQWLFDCLNAGALLPTGDYAPGLPPPPHLSPFAVGVGGGGGEDASVGGYTPAAGAQPVELRRPTEAAERDEDEDEDEDVDTKPPPAKKAKPAAPEKQQPVSEGAQRRPRDPAQAAAEERRMREAMLPKKHRLLYKKMVFAKKRQKREAAQLAEKRQKLATGRK